MKSKRIKSAIILLVVGTLSFQGCKKGEDDPFISFRSRDGRLAGDWTMSGMEATSTTTSVFNDKTTVQTSSSSYSGGEETTTAANGNKSTSKYNLSLVIDKDGTIKYTFEGFDSKGTSTGVSVVEGTWNWLSDGKRKSAINIDISGPSKLPLMGTWDVTQLKNKEMVLSVSSFNSSSNGKNSSETTSSRSVTFTGK